MNKFIRDSYNITMTGIPTSFQKHIYFWLDYIRLYCSSDSFNANSFIYLILLITHLLAAADMPRIALGISSD